MLASILNVEEDGLMFTAQVYIKPPIGGMRGIRPRHQRRSPVGRNQSENGILLVFRGALKINPRR